MNAAPPVIDILLVDSDASRAALVRQALDGSGYRIVATLGRDDDLLAGVALHKPGLVIVDMDSPDRDTLDSLRGVTGDAARADLAGPMLAIVGEVVGLRAAAAFRMREVS